MEEIVKNNYMVEITDANGKKVKVEVNFEVWEFDKFGKNENQNRRIHMKIYVKFMQKMPFLGNLHLNPVKMNSWKNMRRKNFGKQLILCLRSKGGG